MTEHDRETWQQNDYDPKFIETDEEVPRRIALARKDTVAEQIVREHNAFGELLEAANFMLAELGTFSLPEGHDEETWEDAAIRKLSAALEKAESRA